jgi:hypothetical protein
MIERRLGPARGERDGGGGSTPKRRTPASGTDRYERL